MSAYNINGVPLISAYDVNGNSLQVVYDINGNPIPLTDFLDSTTITDIYTSSISSQPQGGCIDDNGNVYVCFYSAGKFLKHNISTGTNTEASFTPNAYGHANGMAYNPNTGYLYLASMNSTGEVFVFDKSFNLVNTLYAKDSNNNVFNCWNICYDRINERFITMASGVIYFFDDSFNLISTETYNISDWANTRQDIETDGSFIYALSYSPNKIAVFDMNGNLVTTIENTAFTGEPESMCYDWINNKYYIEGISTYYVIREAVFKQT